MRPFLSLGVLATWAVIVGCDGSGGPPSESAFARPKVKVAIPVLDRYVGTYRLASGAHLAIVRDGDQLLAGSPPAKLYAQSTRQFSSNHFPGEFHFERSPSDDSVVLYRVYNKHKYRCERVEPNGQSDPSRRISAGEHDLRMLITGKGSPTIVLEDGIGNGVAWQAELQGELAKITQVVTYDHAGTGGSDAGPVPRDGRRIAHELRSALTNAGINPPFVLIGGSIGGDYIRIFAHEFPTDTAGLVLIDPTPDWSLLFEWANRHAAGRADMYRELASDSEKLMDSLMSIQEPGRLAEWEAMDTTRRQASESRIETRIETIQITGAARQETSSIMADKVRFFESWLNDHLPHAKHILAPNSGHAVTITDRQLVLDVVKELIEGLRERNTAEATNP